MQQPEDLTGPTLRKIRKERGLSQHSFWSEIGVSKQVGSNMEREYSGIPQPVRMLAYLRYVLNLPLDDLSALRERIHGFNSIQAQLDELKAAMNALTAEKREGANRG